MLQLSPEGILHNQISPKAKKLLSVLATFTPVTGTKKKTIGAVETTGAGEHGKKSKGEYSENLIWISYIWYPITFRKKFVPMLALLDSGSKVNAIHSTFTKELGLSIRLIDVGSQKINSITLNTFEIVVIIFSVMDKANWVKFFEETFLLANVSLEIVLKMLFLTLNGADIDFLGWKL